jgi:hypothetical protein
MKKVERERERERDACSLVLMTGCIIKKKVLNVVKFTNREKNIIFSE